MSEPGGSTGFFPRISAVPSAAGPLAAIELARAVDGVGVPFIHGLGNGRQLPASDAHVSGEINPK